MLTTWHVKEVIGTLYVEPTLLVKSKSSPSAAWKFSHTLSSSNICVEGQRARLSNTESNTAVLAKSALSSTSLDNAVVIQEKVAVAG